MGLLTNEILYAIYAGVKTEFDAAYLAAMNDPRIAQWRLVADEIETTLPTQNYADLGRGGTMAEFVDRIEEQFVNEGSYSLTDKVYKGNLTVRRRDLEDDQYGMIMKRAQMLAQEPVRHWNQLAFEGLALGFTTTAMDGQYFFDTDHNESGSNQSNKGTSALSDAALDAAEQAMMGFTDDKGIPLNIMPDTLVVGPKNARKAADLVGSDVVVLNVGDGTAGSGATAYTPRSNYFKGRYSVIVNPYLRSTYDDYWFLLDTSKPLKPIIIQNRSDVPIALEDDFSEGSSKIREKYIWTVRGRYVQGYGLWQTAFGAIL